METLNFEQMANINGGVTLAEYCNGLLVMFKYNWSGWNDDQRASWCNAWYKWCAAKYDDVYVAP